MIEAVGKRLRAFRQAAGLSQRQLAEKLNLADPTISNYETGRLQIDADELPRFAEALGIPASAFYVEREQALDICVELFRGRANSHSRLVVIQLDLFGRIVPFREAFHTPSVAPSSRQALAAALA